MLMASWADSPQDERLDQALLLEAARAKTAEALIPSTGDARRGRGTDTETMNTLQTEIVADASARHAQYPQYDGYWNGEDWFLAKITRRIAVKGGVAFERGDIVIAKIEREADVIAEGFEITAFSQRTGHNTLILERDITRV